MRTAQEMKEFAEQYKTDRGFRENPKKVSFETIAENLYEDEDVLFAFAANAGSVGNFGIIHVGIAISKDRLFVVYKPNSLLGPLMGANCKTYNLQEINSVGSQGMVINISLRAEGNIIVGNWSPERRNLICSEIRKIVDDNQATNNANVVMSNISQAEELKKFKELLDAGILAQEEFDAKKKQLLGL